MIFDERLTELRKGLGITQKDFAEKLKIEPSKYNKWENGKTVPDFDTVIKLANYFSVTVDYLIGNSNAKKTENIAIVDELGISDFGINFIKGLSKLNSDLSPAGDDDRPLIDIFNGMLESRFFITFLIAMKFLTNPETNEWNWDPQKTDEKTDFEVMAMNLGYEKLIDSSLNEMMGEIEEKAMKSRSVKKIKE